jgi:hypothetical protein
MEVDTRRRFHTSRQSPTALIIDEFVSIGQNLGRFNATSDSRDLSGVGVVRFGDRATSFQ